MNELNRYIDHTLLDPFANDIKLNQLCEEALNFNFFAVCISPYHISYCADYLLGSEVKIATVVGFPYGYSSTKSKIEEIRQHNEIVDEFDVVINLQALMSKDWSYIHSELSQLVDAAHAANAIIKVIVESGNIHFNELRHLCELCNNVGVDYMKTSTGVLGNGASIEAISFMRRHLHTNIKIKASGGIRRRNTAIQMIAAGADRIGASKSVAIITET